VITNGQGGSSEPFSVDEDRPLGTTFVVTGRWSADTAAAFRDSGLDALELNYSLGYRERSLDFLDKLPVRRLLIIDRSAEDLSPVSRLFGLEELRVQSAPGSVIDLETLPNLSTLAADWSQVRESLPSASTLRDVYLTGFDGVDLSPFGHLRLMALELVKPRRLHSLAGVERFADLKSFRVFNARKLVDLEGISATDATLQRLELQNCPGISNLTEVESLGELLFLGVSDCRAIDSLKPLERLTRLKKFYAWGNTRIADADLSPLASLPALEDVRMRDRREYTPPLGELRGSP
jgi:Leucine-rich repeat (LRR) protein